MLKAIIFDLDGTLYLGDHTLPGAPSVVSWARTQGYRLRFMTNNPRKTPAAYGKKLQRLGFDARRSEIITSTQLMVSYLDQAHPSRSETIFVVGEKVLRDAIQHAGYMLTTQGDAQIVIVGFDTTLTYHKLTIAYRALLQGAAFYATNPDMVCPTPDGGLPDAGTTLAALEAATKRSVQVVAGKPSSLLAQYLIQSLGVSSEECLVVGDRIDTDVRLGKDAGMKTCLVETGVTGTDPIPAQYQPDGRIRSVADLPQWIEQWPAT